MTYGFFVRGVFKEHDVRTTSKGEMHTLYLDTGREYVKVIANALPEGLGQGEVVEIPVRPVNTRYGCQFYLKDR